MQHEITIDIKNGEELHQIKVGLPGNEEERKQMFAYRYAIYKSRGLIAPNPSQLDIDSHDEKSCFHIIATFDGQLVGSVRLIYGDVIPMRDEYFKIELPDIITNTANEKLFEMGRIISTPHLVTTLIPRHFIFY